MARQLSVLSEGIVRLDLFNVWLSADSNVKKSELVFKYLVENTEMRDLDNCITESIRKKVQNFCGQLQLKWNRCHRIKNKFLSENQTWLHGKVIFNDICEKASTSFGGRPQKSFCESSESSKRKKVQHLLKNYQHEELQFATEMSLRSHGKGNVAEIVKTVSSFSSEGAKRMKKYMSSPENCLPIKLTIEEALALYVNNKFTARQYISIQQLSKSHNADIYPKYYKLLEGKKKCYPENILIAEDIAEIQLQTLLNHTISRLHASQSEFWETTRLEENITVLFKWGCDGASGQSTYKQVFTDNSTADDNSIFIISLVPLKISFTSNVQGVHKEIILWHNPIPSSTKFCRPIKILFRKETSELVTEEIRKIEEQIKKLEPFKIKVQNQDIRFHPKLILTMIDGKICSNITKESLQNCYICGCSPKYMNNLEFVFQRERREWTLSFGISSLHAWIKCFECILHIAYRLQVKTWQVKKSDREQVDARKKLIQERFRKKMGLLVDTPKPGFGTTNDGNTARRFFYNFSLAADITGVDEELIRRFGTILRTISSGLEIDENLFEKYCLDTAKLYIKIYPWYYMPQTVHKILIHGAEIIKNALLPIGKLSEEAQEAINKSTKYYRQFNTRKCSRAKCMEDLLHMLLLSSDPVISNLRIKKEKKDGQFSKEVLTLVKNVNIQNSSSTFS